MADYGFRLQFAAVQDALQSAIALKLTDGTPCCVGYPRGGVEDRHVWIDGAVDATLPRHTSGDRTRDEAGRLSVRILVSLTAEAMADARDAALLLAHKAEDALAADRTLGGLVDRARVVSASGEEAIPEERTRQYGITLAVAYDTAVARATVPA